MTRLSRYAIIPVVVILATFLFATAGCPGPKPGTGGGAGGPAVDPKVFKPADEYKYLVDYSGAVPQLGKQMGADAGYTEQEQAELEQQFTSAVTQENISAEANATTVRAHGEYRLDKESVSKLFEADFGNYFPVDLLAQLGPADIKLPSRFPSERWVGHVFVGNPGVLAQKAFEAANEYSKAMQKLYGGPENLDMMQLYLSMYGFKEASEVYGWMGGELVLFLLQNPGFNPEAEINADTFPADVLAVPPFFPLIAISSEQPDQGLEVLRKIVNGTFQLGQVELELKETEIGGMKAIELPVEDLLKIMGGFGDEEEGQAYLKSYKGVGPSVAVAAHGYLLIGSRTAVEAALGAYKEGTEGTGRSETLEASLNLDLLKGLYDSSIKQAIVESGGSDDFEALVNSIGDEVAKAGELGTSTGSVKVEQDGKLILDLLTSRASIDLFKSIADKIKQESAPETGAGSEGNIAGTVFMDGRPFAFCTVQAFRISGVEETLVVQERVTTAGHYQLKNLEPGTYKLVCISPQGNPVGNPMTVEVRAGRFEQVDLVLSSSDAPPGTGD